MTAKRQAYKEYGGTPPVTRSLSASASVSGGHSRIRSVLSTTATGGFASSPMIDDATIMHDDDHDNDESEMLTPGRPPASVTGLDRSPEVRRQQGRARMMMEVDESA